MARFPLTRQDLARFLPNQRSIRTFENLFDTSDSLDYTVFGPRDRSDIAPFKTVYVDINGDDSNDGSLLNPLASIEAGVTLANAISTDNVFVAIGAGRYEVDNPVSLPNNTYLVPWDDAVWVADALNLTDNVFEISDSNAEVYLIGGAVIGNQTTGSGVFQSGAGTTVFCINMIMRDIAGFGFRITNGVMTCAGTELSELDSIGIGYQVQNGATMFVTNVDVLDDATVNAIFSAGGAGTKLNIIGPATIETTNATTFLFGDNSAEIQVLSGVIDGPSNGLFVEDGCTLAVNSFGIKNVTNAIDIDNATLSITGSNISGSTNGVKLDNGAIMDAFGLAISSTTTAVQLDNASEIEATGLSISNCTTDLLVSDLSSIVKIAGGRLDKNNISFPDGYSNANMLFQDDTVGEESTKVFGDILCGMAERGSGFIAGKGEAYTRGMIVITTDDTATSTTDGGNLTDVSTEAASPSGSTFTFQDVDVDHTILFGSDLSDGSDKLQFGGVELSQTTAAIEVSAKSFTWEYWDGTNWTEITVMAHEEASAYRYGNSLFIRANNTEDIHFNITITDDWTKKTISGNNLYWARVRINTTITTAPVFEQAKLITDQIEITGEAATNFHGNGRFIQTIVATGNVFSDTGGIAAASVDIGTGGNAWTHRINNSRINGALDSLYTQFILPKGIDTSCPINIKTFYQPSASGASTDATVTVSVLPIEIQGVLVADPAGGITPTARTLANTKAVDSDAPQVSSLSAPMVDDTKIQQIDSDHNDISDFYEGDLVGVKIEFTDMGGADKDVFVWGVEISGTFWSLGERGQI